jgi:hypothetical protein
MDSLLEMIFENPLGSTLAAAAVVAFLGWTISSLKDWRDGEKIYRLLKSSTDRFRSTHALAAGTRLAESRVAALCSKHSRIRRNELEKQSWRLTD